MSSMAAQSQSSRYAQNRNGSVEAFRVYQSGTHRVQADAQSLYPFMPLMLGRRLPQEIAAKLIAGLKEEGRFLTPYGLATEALSSPYYQDDGYWRGPIWAPPMALIIEGLADLGERAFARELARRFCDCVCRSGFAENFDARTGAPLRDPAYTWTSSVFLLLAHRLLETTD